MAKDTAATAQRAPRGIKTVASAFLDALGSQPPAEQAVVAKGALLKIRETLAATKQKARDLKARDKAKAATAKAKDKARAVKAAAKPAKGAPKRGSVTKGVAINDAAPPAAPKQARMPRARRAAAVEATAETTAV